MTCSVEVPTPKEIDGWEARYWRTDNKEEQYPLGETITDNVGPNFYAVYARDISLIYNDHFDADILVTFDAGEGNVESADKLVAYNSPYGKLPIPTRPGYVFGGWYTEENGNGTEVTAQTQVTNSADHTLYAKWVIEVNYYDDNNLITSKVYTSGTGGTLETIAELGIQDAEYTNFEVWGTTSNATEVAYTDGQTINEITTTNGTVNLYAIWSRTANFYSGEDKTLETVKQYKNNGTCSIEVPTPIAIDTWEAVYWRAEGSDAHYPLTGTITDNVGPNFYAVYARDVNLEYNNHYEEGITVNFNAAGGELNKTSKLVAYNGTYGELPTPTKAGYVFEGWYTGENGTGSLVTGQTTVTEQEEHTLYAKWVIGVNYHNGSTIVDTAKYTNGTITNLSTTEELEITEPGYTEFYGWATQEGSLDRTYTEGQNVNEIVTNSGTVDLYAIWTRTVNFYSGENKELQTATQYINGETSRVEVPTPKTIDTWQPLYWRAEGSSTQYPLGEAITDNVGPNFYAVYSRDINLNYQDKFDADITVTFNAGEGNVETASKTVAYNNIYGALPTPTREGYLFKGWYTGENGTGTNVTTSTIVTQTEAHTLYAKWVESIFTVTINANGATLPEGENWIVASGNETAEKTVRYGEVYGTLLIPTKIGYTFDGWYTEENGGTKIEEITTVVLEGNHTLYAHWTARQYTVEFEPNGGTVNTTSKEVAFNSVYNALPIPMRTGYRFDGWYTEEVAGIQVEETTTVTSTEDHTLYAHWTVEEYTVTTNANGGTIPTTENWINASGDETATKTVTYDSTYGNLPTPTRIGYTFDGWYTEETSGTEVNSDTTVVITNNCTLYAHWTAETYTVTFNPTGGTAFITRKDVTYDREYDTLPSPTREGYIFDGWYTEEIAGTQVKGTTTVTRTEDHTLYAHWMAITYTVAYEANGGMLSRIPSEYQEVEYIESTGTQYFVINQLSTSNFGFDIDLSISSGTGANVFGGYKDGQNTFCYMGTRNNTLSYFPNNNKVDFTPIDYGNKHNYKFIKNNDLQYSYYYDRNLIGTSSLQNNVDCVLAVFTFIDNNGISRTTSTETFKGRIYKFILYDGITPICNLVPCIRITDNEIGMYDTVEGKFYTNQGTGTFIKGADVTSSNVEKMSNQRLVYDVTQNLTANEYTRERYSFTEWNTKPDGSGTTYTDEQEVSKLTTVNGGVVTLYAQWERKPYTVTFNSNGGNVEPESKTITYGNDYGELPVPTKTGYTFLGWNTINLFNKDATPVATNKYIYGSGETTELNEYSIYQINVRPNTTYSITNSGGSTGPGYVVYDSSGNRIAGENYNNRKIVTFTTPERAAYIKCSVVTLTTSWRYDKDIFRIEEGVNDRYLFDKDDTPIVTNAYIFGNGTTTQLNEYSIYQKSVEPNTTYTITNSGKSTGPGYVVYDADGNIVAGENYANREVITFTTPATASYIKFSVVTLTTSDRYDKNTFKLEKAFVTDSTTVTIEDAHTLYATWKANEYTVTANANGGTIPATDNWTNAIGDVTSTRIVTYDSLYGILPTPTRTGYIFDGWFTEEVEGTQVEETTTVRRTENHTLYAHWTVKEYAVAFDANGGILNRVPGEYQEVEYIESTGTQYINTMIYPKSTTKVIYDFAYTGEYTESVQRCGWGSGGSQESFLWGVNANSFQSTVDSNWQWSETGVLFDNNRHTFILESGKQQFDGSIYGTTTIGNTATGTQYLYFFAGDVEWNDTASYYCNQKLYAAQIYDGETLVRNFVPCYRISDNVIGLYDTVNNMFYTNQGEGTFEKGANVEKMSNQHFVYDVAQNLAENAYTKVGYTFAGWNTQSDGSGTPYTDKQEVSNLTDTNGDVITLYAQWTANTYIVRFNKNHDDATGEMEDQTFTYDTAQNLTKNTFTRTGYKLKGWSTDNVATTPMYIDEENVNNLSSTNGEIVTLNAIWVEELIFTKDFLDSGSKYTPNSSTISVTTNNTIDSINYPGLNITGTSANNWQNWSVQSSIRWYKTINFDNYDTLEFYARKGADHGVICVCLDNSQLLMINYSNSNSPTSWTKYILDVSQYTGEHVLSFIGGYRDSTGNSTSNTQYCNIKLTN